MVIPNPRQQQHIGPLDFEHFNVRVLFDWLARKTGVIRHIWQ
jgi:hypothetical protein